MPAGAGGTVLLSYQPTAAYHLALVASAVAAAIVLLLAVWPALAARRRPVPGYEPPLPVSWQPVLLAGDAQACALVALAAALIPAATSPAPDATPTTDATLAPDADANTRVPVPSVGWGEGR